MVIEIHNDDDDFCHFDSLTCFCFTGCHSLLISCIISLSEIRLNEDSTEVLAFKARV